MTSPISSTKEETPPLAPKAVRLLVCLLPPLAAGLIDLSSVTRRLGEWTSPFHIFPCASIVIGAYLLGVLLVGAFCSATEESLVEECAERVIRLNGEERRAWLKKVENELGPEFVQKVIAALS